MTLLCLTLECFAVGLCGQSTDELCNVVGDLNAFLVQDHGLNALFEWNCEDIAFLDLPTARISLGWDIRLGRGYLVA